MTSFFAFLHHIAAFALVGALAIEFVLIKGEVTAANMRKIALADAIFGISAGIVLVVGLMRVFYFEKGADYYFHSAPFIVKLSLFVIVALLSIYPTIQFLSWRKPLKTGKLPIVDERKMRAIGSMIHWELLGVLLIILCAVLMARGVAYLG